MKNKPFFYRLNAGEFLAALVQVPESDRAAWAMSLALDLISGEVTDKTNSFAACLIEEAVSFSEKRRNSGKLGGLAKASNAKTKSSTAIAKASTPLASSSSSNSKELKPMSGKPSYSVDEIHISVIDYLNLISGSKYKVQSKKTIGLINARIAEGFTLDDFKTVIDKKVPCWKHDQKMAKFIRPETLFSNKFEGYLNEISVRKSNVNKDGVNWCGDTIC